MALFNNKYTSEGQPQELALFAVPPTQTGVERAFYQEFRPVSQITGDGPLQFTISGNGADYLDLKHSKLHLKLKIVKSDGAHLQDDELVTFINLPMQSMWSQIDVSLGGRTISAATSNYPYKAYIQALLDSSEATKVGYQTAELYYEDTPGAMDQTDPMGKPSNIGLFDRYPFTKGSKSVNLEGVLHEDLFHLDRYLLNGVDLQLKLYRNKKPFCLMAHGANPDYKIIIEDAVFKARKIKLNPAVIVGHSKVLEESTSKYPFMRTEVKTVAIPTGQTNFVWDNIYQGIVPSRIIVGLVEDKALSGDYKKSPFNFAHHNVSSIGTYLNGESINSRPYKLNFPDQQYISAFVGLKEGTARSDFDNGLERASFAGGYALYVFPVEPQFGFDYTSLLRKGNLRLEIQFTSAILQTLSCVIYSEFPSLLEIDHTRNIIYNPQ